MEILKRWKRVAVPDWENVYSISDQGDLRRDKRGPGTWVGRIIRPRIKKGYPVHSFRLPNGKQKFVGVSILVLSAFRGACPKGMEARHLNDVKLDSRLENLRWGTRKQNTQDKKRNGIKWGFASLSPYMRSKIMKETWRKLSPIERSKRNKKGWATRHKI